MRPTIEVFYDFRSPYSYLALTELQKLDADISLRPIQTLKVMEKVGNVPTTLTCQAKSNYARADLGRWAQRYGLVLNPSDMRTNDGDAMSRAVLSAADSEAALAVTMALYRAIWTEAKTLSNSADIIASLAASGLASDSISAGIDSAGTISMLSANTDEAAERGVFGSPTMFVGDQMYFGNDRVVFLKEELSRLGAEA